MMGTRLMSGSDAIRFRNRVIAATESSIASSMLTSMIWAPFSTCWRATSNAASKSSFRISFLNFADPVTFVRSPILMNVAEAAFWVMKPKQRARGRTI